MISVMFSYIIFSSSVSIGVVGRSLASFLRAVTTLFMSPAASDKMSSGVILEIMELRRLERNSETVQYFQVHGVFVYFSSFFELTKGLHYP